MAPIKVGTREFREQIGVFLESDRPVAITKHGRTVGFYIPARRKTATEDLEALREAGRTLDAWMAEHGVDGEAVVEEFKQLRKKKRGR